jgi:hypothetical protein
MRITYKDLDTKYEGKGWLGRPVCRWKDTIKEIIWEGLDWIWLRIQAIMGMCEHNNEP